VILWYGVIVKEKLKKIFHLQSINKMLKVMVRPKNNNKNNLKMHNKINKIKEMKAANKNNNFKINKMLYNKNQFSIPFGKILTINQEFLFLNTSLSKKSKIKFLLLKDKMLKFLLFVQVSFMDVGKIRFIHYSRQLGFKNQLSSHI
jgi:hypothetical protein